MSEEKKINPEPTELPPHQDHRKINPIPEQSKELIDAGGIKIPYIGKKKTFPIDLFGTGPSRGGSLGNWKKKK